jgi:hypothetical protein
MLRQEIILANDLISLMAEAYTIQTFHIDTL